MSDANVIKVSSERSFASVCDRLPEVCQAHAFGVLGVHDLRQKLESKGQDFHRECRVFEVCNPAQAKIVLSAAIEVSTALPCRIAVWEEDGRAVLATIKPSQLLAVFDAPGAAPVAAEVERALVAIMQECAAP